MASLRNDLKSVSTVCSTVNSECRQMSVEDSLFTVEAVVVEVVVGVVVVVVAVGKK